MPLVVEYAINIKSGKRQVSPLLMMSHRTDADGGTSVAAAAEIVHSFNLFVRPTLPRTSSLKEGKRFTQELTQKIYTTKVISGAC